MDLHEENRRRIDGFGSVFSLNVTLSEVEEASLDGCVLSSFMIAELSKLLDDLPPPKGLRSRDKFEICFDLDVNPGEP